MKRFARGLLGLSRWKLAVLAAAVVAAVSATAFGGYTAWNQAQAEGDTQGQGDVVRYRWGNVSIEVPTGGGVEVVRYWDAPGMYSSPGQGLGIYIPVIKLVIRAGDEVSGLMVDANTGEVAHEDVRPEHRAAFDAILKTVRLEGPQLPEAAWPYGETAPQGPRVPWGNITFLMPDPASGIVVYFETGDGVGEGGQLIVIRSVRSRRAIDAATGQIFVDSEGQAHDFVDDRDREAFDRFTSEISVVGT
jgi:hypothetical protein